MENQTNPASWPWFQLMSDALEGRLAGKAPRVTPLWSNEEYIFSTSPPTGDRDCLLTERNSGSELEDGLGGGDGPEADGNVTYIDASGEECSTPSDFSYKMTEQDTRRLIKLRAANEILFTGRRNAAKAAWKAILKELGLLGKVSTYQVSKKWDNLKRRYKDLKYPPVGMENMAENVSSWPWFHLMNEAMEGRLADSAPLLTPITQNDEQHPESTPRHRPRPPSQDRLMSPPSSEYGPDSLTVGTTEECQRPSAQCAKAVQEQRLGEGLEWEMVERERAAVDRERAAVQAERLWLERERAALERDRAMVEQERTALSREREVLENQRAMILNSVGHNGHLGSLGI